MALPETSLRVEVVSADGLIWEGDAISVVARTTEGDIGVMANHEPLLAILEPSAAEILSTEGLREIVAVDGGFLSVSDNRVAVLSSYARMAAEFTLDDARHELAEATKRMEAGAHDTETRQHFDRATAQVHAATKAAERR